MGGNISEKTGCRIEPRMDADTSNLIPRYLALEGMSDDVTGSDIAARPEVNKKHTVFRSKSCFLFNWISKGIYRIYMRDISDVLVTSRPPFYLQIQQEFHFLPNSLIAVRITRFSSQRRDHIVWCVEPLWCVFVPNLCEKNKALPHWRYGDDPVGSPIQLKYCFSWSWKFRTATQRTFRVSPRTLHTTLPCRVVYPLVELVVYLGRIVMLMSFFPIQTF